MVYNYYNWLVERITGKPVSTCQYKKLLRKLYETEFTWIVEGDENRAGDGIALRRQFAEEGGFEQSLNDMPCSVLEMMIALAERIDQGIMRGFGPDYSAYDWFWCMIENLGLDDQNDRRFDQFIVCRAIQNMLDRRYVLGQRGALFVLKNCSTFDTKKWHKMEIWLQMTAWLNENFIKI